jgi:hypothetical protein
LQAPIIAAKAPEDAADFASVIKSIFNSVGSNSRVAVTGSGMVSLLNSLRAIPPNGYTLWGAMSRVHLGATPPSKSLDVMAKAIVGFRAKGWPIVVVQGVTPSLIVTLLTEAIGTAPRPALIAYMADLMGDASIGTNAEISELAKNELLRKMNVDAVLDYAAAMAMLRPLEREQMYLLATAKVKRSAIEAWSGLGKYDTYRQLLDTFCEPVTKDDDVVRLLFPYGALFASILSPLGTLLIDWKGGIWSLDDTLRERLRFFGEHKKEIIRLAGPAISSAVLESLARNGVGITCNNAMQRPPVTLNELWEVPALRAILELLRKQQEATNPDKTSQSFERFEKLRNAETLGQLQNEVAKYTQNMGVCVLIWLRHVEAHVLMSKEPLMNANLSVSAKQHNFQPQRLLPLSFCIRPLLLLQHFQLPLMH